MGLPRFMVAHSWRKPKIMIAFMLIELPLTVAFLTLAGIADDDLYRTKLWQVGSDNGFNSNPNEILYAYANYRPMKTPTVWSPSSTEFNIVISVLSLFVLLVKSAMFTMHAFVPLLSTFAHIALVALYAVSIRNQSAPDMSDSAHPAPGLPWYLTKGCSYAQASGNYGYCMQARATYGVVIVMFVLFVAYTGYSIWSSIPTKLERTQREAERQSDIEMKQMEQYEDEELSKEETWMQNQRVFLNLPKTPKTPGFGAKNPMTPRTTAFAKLSGGEMPKPKTPGKSRFAPTVSGALPFREHYSP